MTTPTDRCLIWPNQRANVHKVKALYIVEDSDRVGTSYSILRPTQLILESKKLCDRDRAKLTTILLNLNRQGVETPEVTPELINRALSAPSLSVDERADRFLMFIGSECDTIDEVYFSQVTGLLERELAWTESNANEELVYLWDFLYEMKWTKPSTAQYHDPKTNCIITPAGHARIGELSTRTDSAQAFVAMWFDGSVKHVYDEAIDPAIRCAGYEPYRVDQADFLQPITDQIIAEIRRSRFLVADFTHGCNGARGSVYYEAGFAHGLNIPVIFTAREGTTPHFDTATYPHIFWNPDELPAFQDKLRDRILAIKELGEGPRRT